MEDAGRLLRLVGIALVIAVVLVGAWLFLMARKTPAPVLPKIQEVTLTQGERSITVKRSGTIIVRIPEGVFQQQWDEERVAEFFARFESQDFSGFAKFGPEEQGYIVKIVASDGSESIYYLPLLDVPLPQVVQELVEALEEVSQVMPTPTPIPTPTPYLPFPTPTPTRVPTLPPPPVATPTPSGGGGGGVVQKLFECDFTDPQSLPDILSQTVCTIIYSY